MNEQQEFPLQLRPRRRRRSSQSARALFTLGQRLEREVQFERLQKLRRHGRG